MTIKQQDSVVKIISAIGIGILSFGIAYGTMKAELCDTKDMAVDNVKRIGSIERHLSEMSANQKWLIDSNRRIENKLDKKP